MQTSLINMQDNLPSVNPTMTTANQIASNFNFYTHLLTTNTIPSLHDRNTIYHMLSSIDKDISQAQLDVVQLQKTLEERNADHAALIQRRASLAAVVSPLRGLPLEIFGHIFAYATLDDPRFPISASHVCRLWRQASFASSDIWTTIRIGNRCSKEFVALFIQQSRSRPVSLKCTENLPIDSLPDVSSVLSEVGWDCQWKEVHVHPSWDNLPKILSKSLDTLESLILTGSGSNGSKARVLDLKSANRLRRLSITHGGRIIIKQASYELFRGLTDLNLNIRASPKTIFSIMSECRKLEECVLTIKGTITSIYTPKSSAQLPNLRKLHIRSLQTDALVKFFQTPILDDLLLSFDGSDFDQQGDCLVKFINASKPTLRKFSVSMVSDYDLIEMLKGMNRINELRLIGNDGFDGDTLKALVIGRENLEMHMEYKCGLSNWRRHLNQDESKILLPNLGVLHVVCKTYSHVQRAFLDVVRSRRCPEVHSRKGAVARLKTAVLQNINADQLPAFGAEVDDIRRQGFDIRMLEGLLEDEADRVQS